MNSKLLVALLTFSLCVAIEGARRPGGLSDEMLVDDEVKQLVRSVHAQLEDYTEEIYVSVRPIRYRYQIVAGMNFFIKALVTTGDCSKSYIHMRVFRSLKDNIYLQAVRINRRKDEPIEYFN